MKSEVSSLSYWLFKPSSWTKAAKSPVMLFLHGAGGVNNPDNIRGQSITRMLDTDAEYAARCRHIVVMPVAPSRGWPQHSASVLALLDEILAASGADADRVAVAGQSMGGNGCWDLASRFPERFCCAVPVCGYLERSSAEIPAAFNLAAFDVMPVWAFHGADDSVVDVGLSDVVVDALKERGAPVKYTRYAEGLSPPCVTKAKDLVGHGSYELAFKEEGLWEWIEAQRRQA